MLSRSRRRDRPDHHPLPSAATTATTASVAAPSSAAPSSQPSLTAAAWSDVRHSFPPDRPHPDRPLPDRVQWAAAVAVAVGLTLFLLAARPTSGAATAPIWTTTVCAAVAAAAGGAAMLYGRDHRRRHRAFVYGLTSGLAFGLAGLLLKEAVGSSFAHWQAWVTLAELGAVGGLAILLAQLGFQAGPLVQSLPVATVVEPVVAVALSGPLFAEYLASGALNRAGQVVGAVTLVGGIVVLARRTAQREQPDSRSGGRPSSFMPSAPHPPDHEHPM
jgi:hypothetical protein